MLQAAPNHIVAQNGQTRIFVFVFASDTKK